MLKRDTRQVTFIYLGRFLKLLVMIKPEIFMKYLVVAEKVLEKLSIASEGTTKDDNKALLSIVFCENKNDETVQRNISTLLDNLSSLVCTIITRTKRNMDDVCNRNLKVICSLVSVFNLFTLSGNDIYTWFSTDSGRKFWKPLVHFVCGTQSSGGNSLQLFTLQRETISLFHEILYLNPTNQEFFCKLLINLLEEVKAKKRSMTGYMKLMVLQLVIAEDTITVHFKSKCEMYILQNTHRLNMRITATLNEIEQTLLKIRGSVYDNTAKTEKEKVSSSNDNNLPAGLTEYMLQTGKMAAFKRQNRTKPEAKHAEKPKSTANNQLLIEFFLADLSDKPLPKTLQFGQVLQLLYDKDPELLLKPPLLEYSVSYAATNSKEGGEFSGREILETPCMCTMLETFAHLGGLPLLTAHISDRHEDYNDSYIALFSMILPLPGFSRILLKDRTKAEFLLRLMVGVKETKAGRKSPFNLFN